MSTEFLFFVFDSACRNLRNCMARTAVPLIILLVFFFVCFLHHEFQNNQIT